MSSQTKLLQEVSDALWEAREKLREWSDRNPREVKKEWALEMRKEIDSVRRDVVNHWSG